MVYILSKEGKPLMPTSRHGKVKYLLKSNRAKVVKRTPFVIQLLYDTTEYVQPVTLGVDAGSKVIGLSATTENDELFASEVTLRNDIVELLSTRRQNRRTRRNHLRYREPRFNNRTKSKGWLAPSIQHKVDSHLRVITDVYKILPITKFIVETASFDIQKIRDPQISGAEYQQGDQMGFWNVREYVLFRDGHICQHCKGKSKDKRLNVHHLESRKTGGNSPANLVTLCETCHSDFHKGKIELKISNRNSFRDAAFMGIMRWEVYNKLREIYPNVSMTYGYITKNNRTKNNRINSKIEKTHNADAFCITGNLSAKRSDVITECFIFGRRATGYFDLRKLNGTSIHKSASVKNIKLLEKRSTLLIERQVTSRVLIS